MAFWKSKGSKSSKDDSMTLSDIVRGIQHCVNSAYEMVQHYYMQQMDQFFDKDGNPYKKTIKINEDGVMDVPLFTMESHKALEIDEMKVRMSVNVSDIDMKANDVQRDYDGDGIAETKYSIERSTFQVDMLGDSKNRGKYIDIEIIFKAGAPPEAVSRVSEQLTNTMIVKPKKEE